LNLSDENRQMFTNILEQVPPTYEMNAILGGLSKMEVNWQQLDLKICKILYKWISELHENQKIGNTVRNFSIRLFQSVFILSF
jgi:K+/H+ antiporter YhaU regulatory subunit KhtT